MSGPGAEEAAQLNVVFSLALCFLFGLFISFPPIKLKLSLVESPSSAAKLAFELFMFHFSPVL